MLSVRDAARLLGVHPATVYKLALAGGLAHLRIANAVRFRRTDLDAYIAARRQGG